MTAEQNQAHNLPSLAFILAQIPPCQWAGLLGAAGWYGFWTATHGMFPPTPKAIGGLILAFVLGVIAFLIMPEQLGFDLQHRIGWSGAAGMGGAPIYRSIVERILQLVRGSKTV